MSVDEISSNEFDSDDSVKDPDLKLKTYRKRNKCTQSSDYDSDISIPDKPDKSSKRKRTQNSHNQSSVINSEGQELQNIDLRNTEHQANENETFVAQQIDNETAFASNMIAIDQEHVDENDMDIIINTDQLDAPSIFAA